MKQYQKIYREDNYWDENTDFQGKIQKIGTFIFQEKVDGSNFTVIYKNKGGDFDFKKFTYWSRNKEVIDGNCGKEWQFAINLFKKSIKPSKWVDTKETKFHMELVYMAKLPYNKTHKGLYLFEVRSDSLNDGLYACGDIDYGIPWVETQTFTFKKETEYDEKVIEWRDNKISKIDLKTKAEGVVTKLIDGSQHIKYVSKEFQEIKKEKFKDHSTKLPVMLDNPFTDARIEKHLRRMVEDGKFTQEEMKIDRNIGKILKETKSLVDDIIEEEMKSYISIIKKTISKTAARKVAKFVKGEK